MSDQAPCTKCGGVGLIQVDDFNIKSCICFYAKVMAIHLGPEISRAKGPKESPLYVRGAENKVQFDATTENLFLKGAWLDLIPHFKYVLSIKGIDFSFLITTDEKIKTVFVGAEAYGQRSKRDRDDVETYNSLGDLMEDPSLVIVRLGYLGHKNIAAPGALKEALMHREVLRKPTWIVEEPSSIFGPGHLSFNDDVGHYIYKNFKVIEFEAVEEITDLPRGINMPENIDPETTRDEVYERHMPKSTMVVDNDDIDSGMSVPGAYNPKKRHGNNWKPKPKRIGEDSF